MSRHVDNFDASVTLGDIVTIAEDDGYYNSFPGITQCANGDLLLGWRRGTGHTGAGTLVTSRSTDNGATWSAFVATPETIAGTATLSTMSDGRVCLATWRRPAGVAEGEYPAIRFSSDHGVTWFSAVSITHDLPQICALEGPVVEWAGKMWVAVWGQRLDDGVRSVQILTSTDNGASFVVDATIADGVLYPDDDFNETGLLPLRDRLVAVIREGPKYCHKYRQRPWSVPQDTYRRRAWGGAPKTYWWPDQQLGIIIHRGGSTGVGGDMTGDAWMFLTQRGWRWWPVAKLSDGAVDGKMMYGQACRIDAETLGVVYAIEDPAGPGAGRADVYFRTATVAVTP